MRAHGLFLWALAAAAGAAEESAEFAQYFGELPVVLSASRLVQPVDEAPAAVTVIDRAMIRASGARQIAEIFRLVPGFLVTYRNGHAPAVTYHGLADSYARRLQVMIDGVSVYSPLFGGVDWNDLPIGVGDIERIEIVRGPNGASYGANAFVGMVNIITREPTAGGPWELGGNIGSNGIADASLRRYGGAERFRYRLSVGQREDDGFDGRQDSSRVRHVHFRAHQQIDDKNEVMGTLAHASSEGWEHYQYVRPRRVEDTDLRLRWTAARGEDEFWWQFHHAQRRTREHYVDRYVADLRPFGGEPVVTDVAVNFDADSRRDEAEFQQTFGGHRDWRLVLGGQWREDAVRSRGLFGRAGWLKNATTRIFGSAEWKPRAGLMVHVGATYERNQLSGGSLSPRLTATAWLASGHSVRAGISRARRAPTLFEEYTNQSYPVPAELHAALASLAPRLPSPWNTAVLSPILAQTYRASGGLVDEQILSREFAYLGRLPSWRLSGELRWFDDRARDLIYLYRVPFATALAPAGWTGDVRNRDWADIHGVEGSLAWVPWTGAQLSVAAARTVIESSDGDVTYSLSAPVHSASALFRQELPGEVSLALAYYRTGPMTWLSGGHPLPASRRLDLRLAKVWRWGAQRLELAWVGQNVTDEDPPEFIADQRAKRVSWLRALYVF